MAKKLIGYLKTGHRTFTYKGREYVLVPRAEFDAFAASSLPALPEPARDGTVPAVEYARLSLARKIIARRQELGMSQSMLADLADVRVETVNRLERGRTSPDLRTIAKIETALAAAARERPVGRRAGGIRERGTSTGSGSYSARGTSRGGAGMFTSSSTGRRVSTAASAAYGRPSGTRSAAVARGSYGSEKRRR